MKPVCISRFSDRRVGVALAGAKGLDQPAVLDSRRAGGLATAAVEAQIEVFFDFGAELEPAVDNRPHEIDSPARAVVFVARFEISRTGGSAQTAMHAVEKFLIVNLAPDPRRIPDRGYGTHVLQHYVT